MIYHFIVNPRARSGLGEMLWKQLEPELNGFGRIREIFRGGSM